MPKKIVKKKKLRLFRVFLILFLLGCFFLAIYFYMNTKVSNLVVLGNQYLSDDEVLEQADVIDYPSFYLTFFSSLKKKLLKNPWIQDVKISREFYHVLVIQVRENAPLFYKKEEEAVVLENKEEIKTLDTFRIPTLMNYVPNTKYTKFVRGMGKIKPNILGKISEIEYQPNEHDKDRFLLYMDDGNMVYLTLTKFDRLNYYNDVITQLEGRKGILYLDSGNHFKIME